MIQQFDTADAEHRGDGRQLAGADLTQRSDVGSERGGLAVGEVQHCHLAPLVGQLT
jgi:hypothetical protein